MNWSGLNVAVTGATGFIGGRLVERLLLERGARVRCLVRNFSRCAALSRLKLELVECDLTDPAVAKKCLDGCDTVYHCAHGAKADWRVNVAAALGVYRGARQAGCRRFVHLSTDAVRDFSLTGEIDETCRLNRISHAYVRSKAAVEHQLVRASRQAGSTPLVVLRPSIVFGPGFNTWTTQVLEEMHRGVQFVVGDGTGICNTTYVDNLIDAMWLAAERDEAVGQIFFVTDGEPVPWHDYLAAYAQLSGCALSNLPHCGFPEAVLTADELLRANSSLLNALHYALANPASVNRFLKVPWLPPLLARWKPFFLRTMAAASPLPVTETGSAGHPSVLLGQADPLRLLCYASQASISIGKARRLLGYKPTIPFSVAMDRTAAWLRFAGLISA